MKAGVIIAATMAATPAQAWLFRDPCRGRTDSVKLDSTGSGAGSLCPSKPDSYLDGLVGMLDQVGTGTLGGVCTPVPLRQTSGGTGMVYKCDVEKNQNGATTFVFKSKFGQGDDRKLNEAQKDLLESLYDERNLFSRLLDPTYIEDASKQFPKEDLECDLQDLLGHGDEIESSLQKTKFTFLPGLPAFNRDLVLLKLEKKTEEGKTKCRLIGNPSVSNFWLLAKLREWKAFLFANTETGAFRAQNLYPSGDRLCYTEVGKDGKGKPLYEATLEHMITTDIGGFLGALGIYDANIGPDGGPFDGQQADAYLTEAQKLEDLVKSREDLGVPGLTLERTQKSPEKVVNGPGNAAWESVSRDPWVEAQAELVGVQETLSRAIKEGSLPAGLTATRCDVNVDAFGSLYVACSCAGQAQGLDKELFREGMAAVLKVSADRIDGITSSPQGETLVVRFLVGSVGYKAQVDAPASCAERWAVLAGLVVTVLLLAFAAALRAGVLSFRGQSPQAEAGKSVMEVENAGPATEMEKTVPRISADAECAATETQGESASPHGPGGVA